MRKNGVASTPVESVNSWVRPGFYLGDLLTFRDDLETSASTFAFQAHFEVQ